MMRLYGRFGNGKEREMCCLDGGFNWNSNFRSRELTDLLCSLVMMLLAMVIVVILILAFIAALVGLCVFALLTLVVGVSIRSTRFEWLSRYLIWIPSLVAAYAVSFSAYATYALGNSWRFPKDPMEFLIWLLVGAVASAGLGVVIAASGKSRVVDLGETGKRVSRL